MVPDGCSLSPREFEVILLLAEGLNRRQVGQRLGMKPGTVGCHVFNACRKLGMHNGTELVAHAYAAGWVPGVSGDDSHEGTRADRAERKLAVTEAKLARVRAQLKREHADAKAAGPRAYLEEFEKKLRDPESGLAMGLGILEDMRPIWRLLDSHGGED